MSYYIGKQFRKRMLEASDDITSCTPPLLMPLLLSLLTLPPKINIGNPIALSADNTL
jgi:hypothetical protein